MLQIYLQNQSKWVPAQLLGLTSYLRQTKSYQWVGTVKTIGGTCLLNYCWVLLLLSLSSPLLAQYNPNGVTVAGHSPSEAAMLSLPSGVYVDGLGATYIADQNGHRIQKWASGATSGITVAGGNGQGSAANQLNNPTGVYIDGAGAVYVADRYNHRIQKWASGATSGTTVAGGNGQGSAANQLNNPIGLYVDGAGAIYVADQSNHRIQKWGAGASEGTTVAGVTETQVTTSVEEWYMDWDLGGYVYGWQDVTTYSGGAGEDANQLNNPIGLYVDGAGAVYIADQNNHRIQKWVAGATSGTTVAGGNGRGSAANQFDNPASVFVDGAGAVYVADRYNHRIQKWAAGATSGTTVAGGNGQGGAANQFDNPAGVFITGTGSIYVADQNNYRVQKWTTGDATGTTIAGLGIEAILTYPNSVFVSGTGTIYVADHNNHRIQKWAAGATTGTPVAGGNGKGSAANQLSAPTGLFVDGAGAVYVADRDNHRIQKWASGATSGTTVAGGNDWGSTANQLAGPQGLFVDEAGAVYVADTYNHRIQKWAVGATSGTTVAGGNGAGSNANQFYWPAGVFVDGAGAVYVADRNNNRIQKWEMGATSGTTVGGGNGKGSAANQLSAPTGLFVDGAGAVYVADRDNNRIQKWASGATSGTTVAGGNGQGSAANQFNNPMGVYVDGTGIIYVADSENNRIQQFSSLNALVTPTLTIATSSLTSCQGSSVTFTATPTNGGTSPAYQWTKNGTNVGTDSATYTDTSLANGDVVSCVLTSNDPGASPTTATSNSLTMTVNAQLTPAVAIAITTGSQTSYAGTPITFTATPTNGGTSPAYQWTKNGTNVGTNSATYTDVALANGDVISCVLTSNVTCLTTPTVTSNSLTMTVNALVTPTLTIATSSLTSCQGSSVTFTATPTNGGTSPAYQWTKNGTNVGTNSATYSTTSLANGDVISCVLTSNHPGASPTTATSNSLTMIVNVPTVSMLNTSYGTVAGVASLSVSSNQTINQLDWYNGSSLVYTSTPQRATTGITVAGGNGIGSAANQLSWVDGGYVDASGVVYVVDVNNHRIMKFAPGSTSASSGTIVAGGNGQGSATNQLNTPNGVFMDRSGAIYIPENGNSRVIKFPPGSTSATSGTVVAGGNGKGSAANQLSDPRSVFVDGSGAIYVADLINQRIQKFPPGSTSATSGSTVAGGNGGGSAANQLNWPYSLAVDGTGTLYVSDMLNHRIQKFPPGSTKASNGTTVAGGNGSGSAANQFNESTGLYMDGNGTMYVADMHNHRIQMWASGASSGTTVAGGNGQGGAANQLNYPRGVYVDGAGAVYVADQGNQRIQKWDASIINPVYVPASPGDYSVVVTSNGCTATTNSFSVTTPVTITTQPVAASVVCPGATVTAAVSTTGPVTGYQWYKNGTSVSGATSATLILTNAQTTDAGSYSVVVTGINNSVTSTAFNLTINTLAGITTQPVAGSVVGARTSITAFVSTTGTVSGYQWYKDGTPVSGQTSATLTLSSIQVADEGNYWVVVLGSCNSLTSTAFSLLVPITAQPVAASAVCVGATVTAAVSTSGTGSTYQWYKDGTALSGQTSATLTLTNAQTTDAGSYWVVVTGTNNSVTSTAFALTVNPIPSVSLLNSVSGSCVGVASLSVSSNQTINQMAWYNGGSLVYNSIPRIATTGITVAGGNGQGGAANQLNLPEGGGYVDATGAVYVADAHNHRIQKWAVGATSGITVAGGNGGGSATNQLNDPKSIFVDGSGVLYVAEYGNSRIIKFPPGSTSATSGTVVAGGNGSGSAANQFSDPRGVFVDGSGTIYVADYINNRVQKFAAGSTSASSGTTVAGGNGQGGATNQLSYPYSLVVDAAGAVYVSDMLNHRIIKFPAGSTKASSGTVVAGGNGGGSAANQFNQATGLYVDGSGTMYISDYGNNRIQKWASGATSGTTVAGGNGQGSAANQFNYPRGVYVDGAGAIYVADYGNHRVQKWAAIANPIYMPTSVGSYSVVVTSASGCTATTNSVTVTPQSTITAQPVASSTVCVGATVTASVSTSGTISSYQWYKGGTAVSGQTSATLTLTNVQPADAGSYWVVASDCNSLTSTPFSLTVKPLAAITAQPVASSVCAGETAKVVVSTSGTVSSYQWYKDGTLLSGQTSATLTLTNAQAADAGSYWVVVSGSCNSLTSTAFSLTVKPLAAITAQPVASSTMCVGTTVKAVVSASGTVSSYQWYKGGTLLSGQTSATLTLTNAQVADAGNYWVVVSGSCNSLTSTAFSLTVNPLPTAPTLSSASRSLQTTLTPLSLTGFVVATTGNTLRYFQASGSELSPPTVSVASVGVLSYSIGQTSNTTGCMSLLTPLSLTITTTPTSQTVCRSTNATLDVTVVGTAYQWYKNGTTTANKLTELTSAQRGTTTPSLTLINMQATADYYCKITTPAGVQTVGPLKVTVNFGCLARLGADEPALQLSLLVTPNPVVDGHLHALVKGAQGQPLTVSAYSLQGELVNRQVWDSAPGELRLEWDISQWSRGVVLLRAQTPTQQQTIKVIQYE